MRAPRVSGNAANSAGLSTPAIVVALVLLLGATIYLWRARYIRRRTAYVTMAVLVLALVLVGVWMYRNPMQGA
jgi:hypothetical protein